MQHPSNHITLRLSLDESPNVVLELTSFLATGAATEGLADFIMSSDQTSDRVRLFYSLPTYFEFIVFIML